MTCMWQRVTQDHATKYHVSTAGGIYRCTLYPGIGFRGNSADDANNCGTVLVLVLYRTRYQVYYTWYIHKVSTFRFLLGRRDASRWLGWSTDTLNKDRCPARPSRDDRRGCDTTGVVERGDRGVRCMCPSTMCTYYAFDLQQHHTS